MKLLFISDIHGYYNNLKIIEKQINNQKIDKLIVLGDLYYQGPSYNNIKQIQSNKVKEFLNNHKEHLICMKGNCDSEVDIKASDFPINEGISYIFIDKLNIYITHGNKYNINKNKLNQKEILIYGHEHIPYIKQIGNKTYINVGSISFPRNNNKPTYMIYNNKTFTIYDIETNIIDSIEIK